MVNLIMSSSGVRFEAALLIGIMKGKLSSVPNSTFDRNYIHSRNRHVSKRLRYASFIN